MGIITNLLGLRSEWKTFSDQNGYRYTDGIAFKSARVTARYKNWTIALDTYTVGRSGPYTRIRVPYVPADNFKFSIRRSGILSKLGEALGLRDVKIGFDKFDEDFVIKANDEAKVKNLLGESQIRELIAWQPDINLSIRDQNDRTDVFSPRNTFVLYFSVLGYIDDIGQLKGLFDIFTEILNRLCMMESARQCDPKASLV